MADTSYAAGRFAISIDGDSPGFLKKVSGGDAVAQLVTHNLSGDPYQRKNVSTYAVEDLTVELAVGQGKGLWEWIKASFDKGFVQKNIELIAADFDYKAKAIREYKNVFISEVTCPACDGASKDAMYLTVKMAMEDLKQSKGDDKVVSGNANVGTKSALCSNFRLNIDGLPCERVSKIDSWTWKQKVIKDEIGSKRTYTRHAAAMEVPNLKVTISMADIDKWAEWHQSFVIDGKCADSDEKSGSIEILSPDLSKTLLNINLSHLGIISLKQEGLEANKEGIARFTVELYCEEMTIDTFDV